MAKWAGEMFKNTVKNLATKTEASAEPTENGSANATTDRFSSRLESEVLVRKSGRARTEPLPALVAAVANARTVEPDGKFTDLFAPTAPPVDNSAVLLPDKVRSAQLPVSKADQASSASPAKVHAPTGERPKHSRRAHRHYTLSALDHALGG